MEIWASTDPPLWETPARLAAACGVSQLPEQITEVTVDRRRLEGGNAQGGSQGGCAAFRRVDGRFLGWMAARLTAAKQRGVAAEKIEFAEWMLGELVKRSEVKPVAPELIPEGYRAPRPFCPQGLEGAISLEGWKYPPEPGEGRSERRGVRGAGRRERTTPGKELEFA